MRNCHILMMNMMSKRKIDSHNYLNHDCCNHTDLADFIEQIYQIKNCTNSYHINLSV